MTTHEDEQGSLDDEIAANLATDEPAEEPAEEQASEPEQGTDAEPV